jgi:hypothetical protein
LQHRRAGAALFCVVAAALLAFLFRDSLLHGHALGQADILFGMAPWEGNRPPGWRVGNPLLSDVPTVFYPFLLHARSAILSGEFPLWSRALGGGLPFLATFQSAVLSPFSLIDYLLPFPGGFTVDVAARLFVGGLGMYVYLRTLPVSIAAALFGGVAFLLNPFSVVWLEHPLSAVAAWTPWLLVCVDSCVVRGDRRAVGALALVTMCALLSGHPETAFKVFLLTAVYATYRGIASGHVVRSVALVACGGVLGAVLASVQIVPFLEYAGLSRVLATRSGAGQPLYTINPAAFVTGFVPNFYGTPLGARFVLTGTNYCEQQFAPGIVACVFAALSLRHPRLRRRAMFFLAAGLVAALAMYGTVVSTVLVSLLPPLRVAALSRFGLITIVGVIVAAAIGFDGLFGKDEDRGRARRGAAIATLAAVTIAAIVGAFLIAQHQWLLDTRQWTQTMRAVTRAAWFLGLTVGLVWSSGALTRPVAVALATLLISCELLTFADGFHPAMPRDLIYPTPAAFAPIARDQSLFRVAGWQHALPPNTALPYGLQDFRSYDGIGHRDYSALLDTGFQFSGGTHLMVNTGSLPLVDLLNVKYIVTAPDVELPLDRFERVHDERARVYRNRHVQPRAFLTDDHRVLAGQDALRAIRDGTIDLTRTAIVAGPLDEGLQPEPRRTTAGTAEIRRYEDRRVSIETEADGRRLLILTDVYYPGWTASVDGTAVPIHRANYAFRAVAVPPGRHVVEFRYRPASVRYGLLLSLAGALVLGWLMSTNRLR